VGEPLRVEAIADADGEAHGQALLGLDGERLRRRLPHRHRPEVITGVVEHDVLEQGLDHVNSGVERSRARPPELADADAGPPTGYDDDAQAIEKEQDTDRRFTARAPPTDGGQGLGYAAADGSWRGRESPPLFLPSPQVEKDEGGTPAQTEETEDEQNVLDEQH